MRQIDRIFLVGLAASLVIGVPACGGAGGDGMGTGGGKAGSGGTNGPGSGGRAGSGGGSGSGGVAAASGGTSGNGGIRGTGGAAGRGGPAGSGGMTAATGGAPGTGGAAGTGGAMASGGMIGSGGVMASGGTIGSGGAIASGGTIGSGGRGGGAGRRGGTGGRGGAGTGGAGTGGAGTGGAGTGGAGTGGAGTGGSTACGAPACFSMFQVASVAIGQANLTSPTAASPGPVPPATETPSGSVLYSPRGNPFFDGTTLYVPDTFNNRVLMYPGLPTAGPGTATAVIGQSSVSSSTVAGSGAAGLNHPGTVFLSGGKAFVADTGNNRILIYNLPLGNAPGAVVAVGQSSLTTNASGCTATGLNAPQSLVVTGTKLIVADTGNNRVMIWNAIPTANPTPAASLVLGQGSMTSCPAAATSATTLSAPSDVWSDGTRLAVADQLNNRVLVWQSFPTSNAGPSFVMGQPSFTSNVGDMQRSTMGGPAFLDSDGTSLAVAEVNNHRILVWQQFPTAATALLPDLVLGQPDFTLCNPNAGLDSNGALTGPAAWYAAGVNPVTATGYFFHERNEDQYGAGVRFAGKTLLVSDSYNNRVLEIQGR